MKNELIISIKFNCKELVKFLLKNDIYNQKDCLGNIAIHYAREMQNVDLMNVLSLLSSG